MKVYIMSAEHFSVPGVVVKVCASRGLAVAEGIACTNIILKDCEGFDLVSTEEQMDAAIERIQEIHGAAHCYVNIDEHDLIEDRPWSERAPRQWAMIERVNRIALEQDEPWGLFVCGDGMIVIEWDQDRLKAQPARSATWYVEERAKLRSLPHEIALGLHGMVMTEER